MSNKFKFKQGDKVVLVNKYPDGSDLGIFEADFLKLGNEYVVEYSTFIEHSWAWNPSGVKVLLGDGVDVFVDQDMLVLASEYNKEKSMNEQLKNTKIDVMGYAVQFSISLEQAHSEIQSWLFENGYKWYSYDCVMYLDSNYLYVSPDCICHGSAKDNFNKDSSKQIFLNRNITLTIAPEALTIVFEGKTYDKEEFTKAISQLNVIE